MNYDLEIERHELEIRKLRILMHYPDGAPYKFLQRHDRIKMLEIEDRLEAIRAQQPIDESEDTP
jgi:hypothetical protein